MKRIAPLLLVCMLGCAPKGDSGSPSKENIEKKSHAASADITASVADVWKAYEGNEAAADARYLNKTVRVKHPVSAVKKGNDAYVCMMSMNADGPTHLVWKMNDSAVHEVANIKTNDREWFVTMQGVCTGRFKGGVGKYVIAFERCDIVQQGPSK